MGTQTASNSEGRNPIVARAVDLCKRYGKGDNSVIALDHVNVEFRRKALTAIMDLGFRQIDAHALHGRA